jgi:hypothetical protein
MLILILSNHPPTLRSFRKPFKSLLPPKSFQLFLTNV